ncbi:MAG: CHAT domain-containing protein, partial [Dolichospermum sp.]
STSLLMIKFYQNHIQNSDSVSSALNKSQLWLKNSTVTDFRQWIEETIQDFEHQQVLMSHFVEIEPNCKPFENSFYWAGFCVITT